MGVKTTFLNSLEKSLKENPQCKNINVGTPAHSSK